MFGGTKPTTYDAIVSTLIDHQHMSAQALHRALAKTSLACSIQSIYKALTHLIADDVVIKTGTTYNLSLPWILNARQLLDRAEKTYITRSFIESLIPQAEKERLRWKFPTLSRLNPMWGQVIAAMAHHRGTRTALTYTPHQWFDLEWADANLQFLQAFYEYIDQDYVLVGGRTPLDEYSRAILKDFPKAHCHLLSRDESFASERSKSITVIDDLVLTIALPTPIAEAMDTLYAQTHAYDDLDQKAVEQLLTQRGSIRMTLKRDPKVATRMHKRFERTFGPLK